MGKPGVGLYVEAPKPSTPSAISIRTSTPGWEAAIYSAASGPPDTLAGWGPPIGRATVDTEQKSVPVATQPARFFLIWITKPASTSDGFRVEISDVRLIPA
jgi:hypothetical protein